MKFPRFHLPLMLVLTGLASSCCLSAATYYVATNGDDTRTLAQAQSIATPWLTIQKAATNMVAGDTCNIRAGTYRETVTAPASGTVSTPITFQAYGNEVVTISGADSVTGWVLESPNVYYAPISGAPGDGDQVFQNGAMKPEARWPNVNDADGTVYPWQNSTLAHPTNNELGDWSYVNAAGYTAGINGWLTDPQLPARADGYWNGATAHIMSGWGWIMGHPTVTGYTEASKTLVTDDPWGDGGAYTIAPGNEYYLTGKIGELDSAGEWFNDAAIVTVNGAGADIWNSSDQFQYVSQAASGDCTISANVSAIQNTDTWAKAGVMIRETTAANAPCAAVLMTPNQGVLFQWRAVAGGSTVATQVTGLQSPIWVTLGRVGNSFSAYYSTNGTTWTQVGTTQTITMATAVTKGLAVTSHNTGLLCKAVFSDVATTGWSSQDIGSPALAGSSVSSGSGRLYYYSSTGDPGSSVEVKKRNYGFDLRGRSYIKLVNLDFFACSIQTDANSTYETFDGLYMKYLGQRRKNTAIFGLVLRNGCTLRNSELGWDSEGLVRLLGNDIRMINNYIHDSGYVPSWTAMVDAGIGDPGAYLYQRNLISHNTMQNAGRAIMGYPGSASIVEFNDMSAGMRLTTDGAIYYAYLDAGNGILRNNLLHDSPGPVGHGGASVMGFYLDGGANANWIVHHNIIWNVPGYSMHINPHNNFNMVFNNTCRNTAGGISTGGIQDGETGSHVYNNLFNGTPAGDQTALALMDIRYNLYTDPLFVTGTSQLQATSPALDKGTVIPGVTDGYLGTAPDLGALEYGGTDWTTSVGYQVIAPSPDPVYSMPDMVFANRVKDGSFEQVYGAISSNWTITGAVTLAPRSTVLCRTGAESLQVGLGTSEIRQTVTGLQPNRRYKVYAGIRTADPTAVVVVGVRNYGNTALELIAPVASDQWVMNDLAFVTGATGTSAEIYVRVTSASATIPVYVDDLALVREQNADPLPEPSPLLQYAMDQSSGTTVIDSSIYGQNGTVFGTATPGWQAGYFGNALHFDGVDDNVQSPAIATPAAITVACWAKSDTVTWNEWACMISQRPAFVLHPEKGSRNLRFIVYGSPTTVLNLVWTAPASFDITQWHHYAGVFNPTTQRVELYVDGILGTWQSTTLFAMNPDTGAVSIGKDNDPTPRYFKGAIDDVRIYNHALSAQEIESLTFQDSSLLLHLALDESSGAAKAWDSSMNGSSGVLTNMAPATAWVSGVSNGALAFDGVNDNVQTPAIATPAAITVACWAKSDTATWNQWACMISQRPAFVLHPEQGSKNLRFIVYDSPTTGLNLVWTAPASFDITQWHHYAGVFNPTTQRVELYVDGILGTWQSTTLFAMNPDTGAVSIGKDDVVSPGRYFQGAIDDVRIYSRALPWWELQELSQQFNAPPYN